LNPITRTDYFVGDSLEDVRKALPPSLTVVAAAMALAASIPRRPGWDGSLSFDAVARSCRFDQVMGGGSGTGRSGGRPYCGL
jgi:hypothetical protein